MKDEMQEIKDKAFEVTKFKRQSKETTGTAITKQVCLRCGWGWWPNSPTMPTVCPKCKSPYWNIPRKEVV